MVQPRLFYTVSAAGAGVSGLVMQVWALSHLAGSLSIGPLRNEISGGMRFERPE